MKDHFTIKDRSQIWYEYLLEYHSEEAKEKVASVLADTTVDENGCMVTATKEPRTVRFQGGSDRAYRFVLSVLSDYAPSSDELVRHRCNNRRCVNPDHLQFGVRLENWLDEIDCKANSVGFQRLD